MDYAAASGAGAAFATLGQIMGIFIGIFVAFIAFLVVYLDIWVKFHVRGKVFAFFIDNKSLSGALLKIEDGNKVFFGTGDKKEMYLLDDSKQYLTLYPAALPRFLQVVVRSYWYVKNQPQPIDPKSGTMSALTAKMLRQISDEAIVKQTWKDVREATGIQKAKSGSSLALYLVFGCLALIAFNLYLTMQNGSSITELNNLFQQVFGTLPTP